MENVSFGNGIIINGVPIIYVGSKETLFRIGDNFSMNNGIHFNQIGRQQRCYFIVGKSANLVIGNNVGISTSAIIAMKSITIGDNVKIGGNTVIYDSDFHSLTVENRIRIPEDTSDIKTKPVVIKNNVFIGAHTTILKGVTIGENTIIGAGSVVSSDIPSNQIWAGNPARFIRNL